MPESSIEGKGWLIARYLHIRPASVVDIGPGIGTYSMLMRPSWRSFWLGIEIWEPYVTAFDLADKYDELIVGDARSVTLPHASLFVAGDVLEHLSKADALDLLEAIAERTRHLMVSVPIIPIHQGPVGGNPHEAHIHHWTYDEMTQALADLGGRVEAFRGNVLGAWHWTGDTTTP